MKVLSLFSGVGGFDMGLEAAGMKTVFQCELDKHCRSVLDRHWADVPKWSNVSTLTGKHILDHAPEIDVVAWGSPCQDLSVAGKREGLEGGRSGLFYEGMRIIKELRKASNGKYPRISIWENVYGALNSNKGDDFEAILKEMVEAGSLLCEWRVLDAQYFGVPQRRRRVFVIAVFDSATAARCPDPLLPVSEGLFWDSKTGAKTREESADTVTASVGSGSEWWDGGQIANALTTTSNQQRMPDKDRLQAVVVKPFTPSSFAQYEQGVGTLRSNGGVPSSRREHLVVEPNPAIPIQDGREMTNEETISPTLTAYNMDSRSPQSDEQQRIIKAVFESTMVVRRLTPLECERLMGWSDDHTRYKADGTEQVDTHRYKQCGNGVASPVAQWIGEQIIKLCNTLEP